MERDPKSTNNLQEMKNIHVAGIMTSFRDLVNHGAAPADNTASTGQTAYSSMALETMMSEIVNSAEDLLSMTRKIRELWVIGPLKAPPALDARSEDEVRRNAEEALAILEDVRDLELRRILQQVAPAGGGFSYERADVDGPGLGNQAAAGGAGGGGAQGQAQTQG